MDKKRIKFSKFDDFYNLKVYLGYSYVKDDELSSKRLRKAVKRE